MARGVANAGTGTAGWTRALSLLGDGMVQPVKQMLPSAGDGGILESNVLVAVSGSTGSEALVLAAKALADSLDASWEAVHIEIPGADRDSLRGKQAADALAVAAKLGATIAVLPAATVADGLQAHLDSSSIQHVVLGGSSPAARAFRSKSLLDTLSTRRDGVILHVHTRCSDEGKEAEAQPQRVREQLPMRSYVYAVALVGCTLLLSEVLQLFLGTRPLDLLFLFPVIAIAARLGFRPAMLATILSVICYNYFLLSPTYSFNPTAPQNLVMTGVLIAIAAYTSALTTRMRERLVLSDRSARENASVAALAQKLTRDADWETTAATICEHVGHLLKVQAVVYREVQGSLTVAASIPVDTVLGPVDKAALDWCWAQGEEAGSGTAILSPANWQFQPLKTSLGTLAVLGIARDDGRDPVRADQRLLLHTLVAQSALAHERLRLEDIMRDGATSTQS